MTLEEIKADVEHCKAVFCETGEPCYHCAQKLWLIQELEKALNPIKMIVVPDATPKQILEIKQQFLDSINKVDNAWRTPIFAVAEITPEQIAASGEEANTCPGCHRVTCEPDCTVKGGAFVRYNDSHDDAREAGFLRGKADFSEPAPDLTPGTKE